MQKLLLDGPWQMKACDTERWIPAQVPGSVCTDLLRAGMIDDPYYRAHETKALDIMAADYEYRREFDVTADLLSCPNLLLVCEGLDTFAEIRINGTLVANTDNMHRWYEISVREVLVEGRNTIHVVLRSPLPYIAEQEKSDPLWGVPDAVPGFTHIRKAHYMFGWDWGPQIPDAGIWRSISIQGYASRRVDDVYITQSHVDGGVSLSIAVRVDGAAAATNHDAQITIDLVAPNGQRQTVSATVQSDVSLLTIPVDSPQLWWPNGYGEHPLYTVSISLVVDGDVVDAKEQRIGLRTLTVARDEDEWGESFAFTVNGVAIFAQGANYIPEDNLTGRRSKERTERVLRDALDANFNAIRVWGGGYYADDYFYDLCDEMGLVVWQDFMFACGVYRLTDAFRDTVRQEAIDNVRRLRHHASIGLWCGNNEMETAWVDWSFAKPDDLRADYLTLFEEMLPAIVAEYDPNRFYWPSSPSNGGKFQTPNDENRGDVHYWDVWHGLKPFTEYRKFYFRFCSEFGFQSFPSHKTVEQFTLPEDRNIFSYVMERHQKNGEANGKILYYLAQNFKYPKDFDSLLYASQVLQAEAIRYGVEHWRRHRGRCMGSIYWQLNDCWPVASWSSIDSNGRWKALHYAAKRFYQPILLSAAEEGTSVTMCVTNDTMTPVTGEVVWRLRSHGSSVVHEGRTAVTVPALSVESLATIDFKEYMGSTDALQTTYLEYALVVGGETVSSGTVLFVRAKHFALLPPDLRADVHEGPDAFTLHVSASAFAKYVELDLRDADCRFSDNYFDLSAGSVRVITVRKDSLSRPVNLREFQDQLCMRSLYDIDAAMAPSTIA